MHGVCVSTCLCVPVCLWHVCMCVCVLSACVYVYNNIIVHCVCVCVCVCIRVDFRAIVMHCYNLDCIVYLNTINYFSYRQMYQ